MRHREGERPRHELKLASWDFPERGCSHTTGGLGRQLTGHSQPSTSKCQGSGAVHDQGGNPIERLACAIITVESIEVNNNYSAPGLGSTSSLFQNFYTPPRSFSQQLNFRIHDLLKTDSAPATTPLAQAQRQFSNRLTAKTRTARSESVVMSLASTAKLSQIQLLSILGKMGIKWSILEDRSDGEPSPIVPPAASPIAYC